MSIAQTEVIGEHISNFYVIELIGHGAMASVYRAFDTDVERNVALKIPAPKFADDPKFVKRFAQEGKAMAKLSHPNIVHVYCIGRHRGLPFLVMEYVNGLPLSKMLAERGRLEADEAVEYIIQVCKGVEYAHQRGIIHRDLKPSNILAESSGRVLVAAFGLAKVIEGGASKDTASFVGTPVYMSPEQCGEGVLDRRTDIYSLGVVFYELIFGTPPFVGKSPGQIILKHLTETPKIPTGDTASWPPKILGIIGKMLAKDPDRRYPDARSIIRELERWQMERAAGTNSAISESVANETVPLVLSYIPHKVLYGAVVSALTSIRHQMVAVSSDREVLQSLEHMKPTLVIISSESGKGDLTPFVRQIKSKIPKGKLMLLSYGISRNEVETALGNGVNDIIAEPFNPSVLVPKLERALVGEQAIIENRRFFRKSVSGKIMMTIENEILDIGEGGMRISTGTALKTGEIVRFESDLLRDLGLGKKTGKVVWISRNDGDPRAAFEAGIDFVDLTESERSILRKWILTGETTCQPRTKS